MTTDTTDSTESAETDTTGTDTGSNIGEPVPSTAETEAEKDRINSLTDSRDDTEINFFQYTHDDGSVWGHRMELSTGGHVVVPADITAITENTGWNFTGVKNGAVMFEGDCL